MEETQRDEKSRRLLARYPVGFKFSPESSVAPFHWVTSNAGARLESSEKHEGGSDVEHRESLFEPSAALRPRRPVPACGIGEPKGIRVLGLSTNSNQFMQRALGLPDCHARVVRKLAIACECPRLHPLVLGHVRLNDDVQVQHLVRRASVTKEHATQMREFGLPPGKIWTGRCQRGPCVRVALGVLSERVMGTARVVRRTLSGHGWILADCGRSKDLGKRGRLSAAWDGLVFNNLSHVTTRRREASP
jgi:hypothetical protein